MSVNSFNAQNPPVNTKGDLFTFSTIPTKLGVGTNGQYLSADSTTATGLKWATAAAGGAPEYPTIAFNSYTHSGGTSQTASQTVSEDVTYYTAIWLPTCTVDRLSILSGGTWAGTSATVRLGLYNNGSSNLPTTVLLDAGTVTVTAAATTYEITVSQSVTAGLYWFAFNNQTNTSVTTNTYQGTAGSNRFFISRGAVTGSNYSGFEESGITGAFATAGTLNSRSSATPTGYARLA